ncbi:MAG: exodeoxyribonuclease VII small subunit [Candidatus Woesearchaeota archaeon]
MTFEENMKKLEEYVQMLEEGLPLDKSLEAYEEGMRLVKSCRKELEDAESRIEKTDKDL